MLGELRSLAYLGSTVGSGAPVKPTTVFDPIRRSIESRCFLAVSLPPSTSNFINVCVLSAIS